MKDNLTENAVKDRLTALLEKSFKDFCDRKENNYELYREIKVLHEFNPGLIESLGWTECFWTCGFFPKEKSERVFVNFDHFKNKDKNNKVEDIFIYKPTLEEITKKGIVFFDELNSCLFLAAHEGAIDVWTNINKDGLSKTCASFSKTTKFHASRVSRGKDIFSTFETYFKEHAAARNKEFFVPKGECFGLEIEMLFADVFGKLRFSHFIGKNFPNWSCERDGSLEDYGDAGMCGLELVSPPLDINQLSSELKVITAEALKNGARGHDAGIWYGMHINVSIYNGKNATASKFICLINDPKLNSFWQKISRRKGASVEEFCQFQNVSLETCLLTESEDHYRAAFNRKGKNCVEVRIFRSNLKHLTVMLSVEILKLALDFCMSQHDFNNYVEFRKLIKEQGSSNLLEYLSHPKIKAMQELDRLTKSEISSGSETSNNYIA